MITRPLSSPLAAVVTVAAACLLALAGCASPPTPTVNYAAPPPPPPPAPPPPPVVVAPPPAPVPLVPVPFDTAIVNAATALFKNAGVDTTRLVVIDPLIDGVSGEQTTASRYIETRLRDIARDQFP